MDWSDGAYEHTAQVLLPAVDALLARAAVRAGEDVLDVGCGTGTATERLVAVGARVTAVDPAERLLALTQGTCPSATCRLGTAEALPVPAGAFDAAVSSFAAIFSPDPEGVAREIARVLRRPGRFAMTAWRAEGGISAASIAMMEVAGRFLPPAPPRPPWWDPSFVAGLFTGVGARVTVTPDVLRFTEASPEAWFDAQATHHPFWRAIRRIVPPEGWEEARARSVAALAAHNLASDGTLVVDSPYVIVEATFAAQ